MITRWYDPDELCGRFVPQKPEVEDAVYIPKIWEHKKRSSVLKVPASWLVCVSHRAHRPDLPRSGYIVVGHCGQFIACWTIHNCWSARSGNLLQEIGTFDGLKTLTCDLAARRFTWLNAVQAVQPRLVQIFRSLMDATIWTNPVLRVEFTTSTATGNDTPLLHPLPSLFATCNFAVEYDKDFIIAAIIFHLLHDNRQMAPDIASWCGSVKVDLKTKHH